MIPTTNNVSARFNQSELRLDFDYSNKTLGYYLRFEKLLEQEVSPYQTIRVLEHAKFGKTLLLDNDIMSSENSTGYDTGFCMLVTSALETMSPDDEAALFTGSKNILILGGGDCSLALRVHDLLFSRWNAVINDPELGIEYGARYGTEFKPKIFVLEIDVKVTEICERHFFTAAIKSLINRGVLHIMSVNAFDYIENGIFGVPFEPKNYGLVLDDMFADPHKGIEGYYKYLANKFKGTWCISQTDSRMSGDYLKISNVIQKFIFNKGTDGRAVQVGEARGTSTFVDEYMEPWTFTAYRLFP